MARKHGRTLHLVNPAHTTMDCAQCGAASPRDKNSAHIMLVCPHRSRFGDLERAGPAQGRVGNTR